MAARKDKGGEANGGDASARESRRILERIEHENISMGANWFMRTATRARGHFSGADKQEDDPIELWGTRIGRAIGFVIFVALVIVFVRAVMQP